jgi:hypothetical protein
MLWKTSYLPAKPTSESSPPPPPPLSPYMGLQLINTHISRGFPDQFHWFSHSACISRRGTIYTPPAITAPCLGLSTPGRACIGRFRNTLHRCAAHMPHWHDVSQALYLPTQLSQHFLNAWASRRAGTPNFTHLACIRRCGTTTLSSPDWHGRFSGFRPVRSGSNALTTAAKLCYTDKPLTRTSLPPLRSYPSAVPSDVITFPPIKQSYTETPVVLRGSKTYISLLQTYMRCVDSSLSV